MGTIIVVAVVAIVGGIIYYLFKLKAQQEAFISNDSYFEQAGFRVDYTTKILSYKKVNVPTNKIRGVEVFSSDINQKTSWRIKVLVDDIAFTDFSSDILATKGLAEQLGTRLRMAVSKAQ